MVIAAIVRAYLSLRHIRVRLTVALRLTRNGKKAR